MRQFPLLTLQDILLSRSFNDKKASIYIKQCQRHNIVWIQGIVGEIYRIMTSSKVDPKSKIHSIFLLREVIKTCQYTVLVLVECYLLSVLGEIAEYYCKNPSYQMTSKYFISQGYTNNFPNISQLSHNYVILAWQILYICAMVRNKQTFYEKQLNKQSLFVQKVNYIILKYPKFTIKQSQINQKLHIKQLKIKYKKQLQQFNTNNNSYFYVNYYVQKLQNYIFTTVNQKQPQNQQNTNKQLLDFKILLKTGDPYITSQAIARITQIIDVVDDFRIKSKALSIINEMIIWGNVQALITVNFTQYIEKIFKQLYKIDGSKGLKKGQQIFSQIKYQYEQKRRFYSDFLRCTEIWALSFPTQCAIFYQSPQQNSRQILSPIMKHYRFLRQVRKFIFPQNPFLKKIQLQIRQNFRINSWRNKLIIEELNKQIDKIQDEQKVSFNQIKQSVLNASRNLEKLKNNNNYNNGSKKLQIIKNQMEIHAIMKYLIKFQRTFQMQLERITQQSIDEIELDTVIQKGLICVQVINIIQPEYDRLKRGKIKTKQFLTYCTQRIDLSGNNNSIRQSMSLNSSKSIQDRKSQLKHSITNNFNNISGKSSRSIKQMTQQTRIKIIKNQYYQKLYSINNNSNRINNNISNSSYRESQSLYAWSKHSKDNNNNKKYKNNQQQQQKQTNTVTIRSAKSADDKYSIKSPRQTGKKMLIVTKFANNVSQNSNSNTQNNKQISLQKLKQPSILDKGYQFSFIKSNPNLQSQQNLQYVRQQYHRSPQSSGNTQTNEISKSQERKRFKKGVALAKQYLNFAQKLIGPKKDIITYDTFKSSFQDMIKSAQSKKEHLQKHFTLMNNQLVKIDRLSFFNGEKLIVTFFIIPKFFLEKIRFKIVETPSIYINVNGDNNKGWNAIKNYYEMRDLKGGEQYSFELTGILLKAPITMPKLTMKVDDQQQQHFIVPFMIIHMLKFKKPQPKWLSGKDFQQADKIVTQQFERNKQILSSFSDIEDYFSNLVEIKTQQPGTKKYRTEAKIDKTSFLIEIKQTQNKMTFSACLLNNQNSNKSFAQYFVAECLNIFSL